MDSQYNSQLENRMDSNDSENKASQENRVEWENRILRETINHLQTEINKYRQPALMVCDVVDVHDDKVIIKTPNGNRFLVNISSDCEEISAGDAVLCEQKNLTAIKKIDMTKQFNVESFVIIEKPEMTWETIGGLDQQVKEIQEVVELPLKKPQLFRDVGINPPKGVLLHG
ncbi:MAG: proteasome-activating nucleotidase, partial [Nanoarchaeota archaeon]